MNTAVTRVCRSQRHRIVQEVAVINSNTVFPGGWAKCRLEYLLVDYQKATDGTDARHIGALIRDLVRFHPDLSDAIPDDVWMAIYRVRARGTVAP